MYILDLLIFQSQSLNGKRKVLELKANDKTSSQPNKIEYSNFVLLEPITAIVDTGQFRFSR